MGNTPRRWIALLVCAWSATLCVANEANHQPYVVGDRAAGMGGGISAMARSADACYYNPAGLARTKQDSLSVAGVLYGYQRVDAKDALFIDEDASTRTLTVIPSTMSYVRKLDGDAAYGFSVFEPSTRSYQLVQAYPQTDHFYNLNREDHALWLGASYGQRISDRVLLGASLFGVYRSYNAAENLYWGNINWTYSQATDYHSGELVGVVGLQVLGGKGWSGGVTIQTPSLHLFGEGDFYEYSVIALGDLADAGSEQAEGLDAEYRIPPSITLGCAWEKPGRFAWGVDVTWYGGVGYNALDGSYSDGSPASQRVGLESTLDVNTGIEWYLAKGYPLRAGAFTSLSAAPPTSTENGQDADHIDLYGLTCSIGQHGDHTGLDIGVMYTFGKGKAQSWAVTPEGEYGSALGDLQESHLYITVNSVYRF